MKWIGQNIYDLISRFRNDVFVEGRMAIGKRDGNSALQSGTVTVYDVRVDSNPDFSLGSYDTNRLQIQAVYHSGLRSLDYVQFKTYSTTSASDDGEMKFSIDETDIFAIQDAGINIEASKNLSIGGVGILRDSSGTTLLTNIDGGSGNTLYDLVIDSNRISDDTDAEDFTSLHIDLDRTVATSGTHAHNDRGIDLDVTSTSLGTSSLYGMDIDVVGATNGTSTAYGIHLDVDGADTNIGMVINTAGTHLKLEANADADDYATFTLADTGDLTIETVGTGTRDSDLTLDADGDLILDSAVQAANKGVVFHSAGTLIGDINTHHSNTYLTLYENGGASTSDYFQVAVAANGATTLSTVDAADANANFEIAADGNIVLDAAGEVTVEADTINFTSPNADDPAVWIKNTADDDQGARLFMLKNRGADGQDDDECGAIYFYSYDDGTPSLQQYGYILSTIHDATSGEESGKLDIGVANHDGGSEPGISMVGGSANAEVDVTIASGTSSVTTIAGTLTMGSTAAMTNAGLLSVANQSGITGLGTISSGVWNGTAITTAYTKHLMHYRFMGYGTGDGTNYFLGQPFTDAQAPFEHADSSSADGTTIPAGGGTNISELIRSGGHVMPVAATLTKWTGWATYNSTNNSGFISIYKWTPADNDDTDITPVLLDTVTITGKGNDKVRSFAETSFTQASVAAGDIIFTQIKTDTDSKTVYFNSTLEVQF